jgi:hypothetical protein
MGSTNTLLQYYGTPKDSAVVVQDYSEYCNSLETIYVGLNGDKRQKAVIANVSDIY